MSAMRNTKIEQYLRETKPATPCLVLDVDVVAENYTALKQALPEGSIFYAIKANPAQPILQRLVSLGSSFDCASLPEIDMALAAGAPPARISFGNTLKKQADIAAAYQRGVRIFAFDSIMELEKLAASAPGARVFCRVLCNGEGAEWPLSRKFGCEPEMAADLLHKAKDRGLVPWGVSFHVGSQQKDPTQWDGAVKQVAKLFKKLDKKGVDLDMINLGGGFPTKYQKAVPSPAAYGAAIHSSLTKHFGNKLPSTIILEPGRGMVGNAGVIQAEVVLVSEKSHVDAARWVYIDIGKFSGLIETTDECIRYVITTDHAANEPTRKAILAGPTCDSADVMYEKNPYELPESLTAGDRVTIHATGAYTTTYAAQGFNGFKPMTEHYI